MTALLISIVVIAATMFVASCPHVNGAPVEKAPWQLHYERIFQLEDANNDGALTFSELMSLKEAGFRCFRDMAEYLKEEAKNLDTNGDFKITFDELQAKGNATFVPINNFSELKTYFQFFDANLDAVITRSDIETFLLVLAAMRANLDDEAVWRKEFAISDTDEDGKLQFGEMFASFMAFKSTRGDQNKKIDQGTEIEGFMRCHEKKDA